MRLPLAVALLVPLSAPAWAQLQNNGNSVIAVPLAPPIVAAPPTPAAPAAPLAPPPPGLVQAPVPPGLAQAPMPPGPIVPPESAAPSLPAGAAPAGVVPGATGSAPAAPPAPPDAMPVIPNDWVPGTIATLGVLNEIDGGTSQVSIPVGGQSKVGDLQVSVQACDVRPPTHLPDASIFLTVTQQNGGDGSGTTLYRGWMLRSEPGATVVGDASETFRVIGCS
jgi:hypothetical protein